MRRRDLLTHIGTGTGAALWLSPAASAQNTGHAFEQKGQRYMLNLSGPWRLYMDDQDTGVSHLWFEREPSGARVRRFDVTVPSVWQQYLELQGGIGWYYKEFSIPADLRGRFLRIRFEAVDYRARVWLNGREVGRHDGGFTPFDVDISSAARDGVNRLAVRVSDVGRDFRPGYYGLPGWDKPTSKRVDGLSFAEIPAGFQDWREGFDHGGIWQPVSVIASDQVYIADLFTIPYLSDGSVEAHLEIDNRGTQEIQARISVEVRSWKGGASAGRAQENVALPPGITRKSVRVRLSEVHPWSVEDPFLYLADARLGIAEKERDSLTARFGMREFTVGSDGAFFLNGKQFFVKGAHYQSTEPLTLAFPRSREAARQIVEVAKEGGFNFMRGQGRPTVAAILDAADELGLLFQCEPAVSKMGDTPQMEALADREVTEMIRQARNHPSVVIWNMINEQAAGMKVVHKMALTARKLDPSRLITESAGGNSHYYAPYSSEGVSYLTEHYYPGAPLPEGMLEYLERRGVPGQLYFVTEFGYGGMEDVDAVLERYGPKPVAFMEDYHGFVRQKQDLDEFFQRADVRELFPTAAAFREAAQSLQANAIRRHVEAMRSNPRLRGYNIVQLFDSNSNEVDGLVDFWRNHRKKAFAVMQELNQPALLTLQCRPFNALVGQEVELSATLINEGAIAGTRRVRIRARDSAGRAVLTHEDSLEVRSGVHRIFHRKLALQAAPGRVMLEAELLDADRILLKNSAPLDLYDAKEFRWPKGGVTLFDPQHRWSFQRAGLATRSFRPSPDRPEVVVVPGFSSLWRNDAEFTAFLELVETARRGSTILFLALPADGAVPEDYRHMQFHCQFSPLTLGSVLGFRIEMAGGRGSWGRLVGPYGWAAGEASTGSPVPRHPVFAGCPGPGLMDWEYGNVSAEQVVAPAIQPVENTGPTIQIVPFGNGKVVFCTLRLLDNLGKDALAEKLLSNLIGYLDQNLPANLRPASPREQEALQFRQGQVADCRDKFLRA